MLGTELGLPAQIRPLIEKCMSSDGGERPTAYQAAEQIRQLSPDIDGPATQKNWGVLTSEELLGVVRATAKYICISADLDREDRLFPADPAVFFENPLSVAHGAVGVAYALSRIQESVPKPIVGWILRHSVHPKDYPPGLYVGSAGIAWALWELGLEDVGLLTMRSASKHHLLWDDASIYYGASGYGLACLRFYLGTGDQEWLDRAAQIGEWLIRTKVEEDGRHCYWPDREGNIWLSYARGVSGIGLYLLYLGILTGQRHFVETGDRALAFVLSHARAMDRGHLSIPRGAVGTLENVVTHYWLDGSAGVAGVVARFWAHTRDPKHLAVLQRLAPDTFRNITVFPGLFLGLSGLGNFLLDVYSFTGDEHYLWEAHRVANGVLLFRIEKPNGIAFPGDQLLRISTDFGTGSAGIALFLHRLARVDEQQEDFNFTLDHLIGRPTIGGEQQEE